MSEPVSKELQKAMGLSASSMNEESVEESAGRTYGLYALDHNAAGIEESI